MKKIKNKFNFTDDTQLICKVPKKEINEFNAKNLNRFTLGVIEDECYKVKEKGDWTLDKGDMVITKEQWMKIKRLLK
jgi:hypothetical protein